MLTTLLTLLAFEVSVHAFAPLTGVEPKGHEWRKAEKTDSRAPCPGLNSLANHGWLPRDGKNIDYETLKNAAFNGYHYTEDVYEIFYVLATQTFNVSTTGNSSTFNLQDLKAHNTNERDGSLSRSDFALGDDLHFDPAVWGPVAEDLGVTPHGPNHGYVTNRTAAIAYLNRQKAAKAANPNFDDTFLQRNGTRGTTALYLATLYDDEAKATAQRWIEPFFVEERIPYLEGFVSPHPKNTDWIHQFFVTIEGFTGSGRGLSNGAHQLHVSPDVTAA